MQLLEQETFMVFYNSRPCYFIHLVVCLTTGPKPLPKRAIYHLIVIYSYSFH